MYREPVTPYHRRAWLPSPPEPGTPASLNHFHARQYLLYQGRTGRVRIDRILSKRFFQRYQRARLFESQIRNALSQNSSKSLEQMAVEFMVAARIERDPQYTERFEAGIILKEKQELYAKAQSSEDAAVDFLLDRLLGKAKKTKNRIFETPKNYSLPTAIARLYWADRLALQQERRIHRLCPKERHAATRKRYPVTNLFDELPEHIQEAVDTIASQRPKSEFFSALESKDGLRTKERDRKLHLPSDRWQW